MNIKKFANDNWPVIAVLILAIIFYLIVQINWKKIAYKQNPESNFAGEGGDESNIAPTPGGAITPPAPGGGTPPPPVPPSGGGGGTPPPPLPPPPSGGGGTPPPPAPPSGGGGGHHHHRPYPYPYPYWPYNYGSIYLLDTFDGGSRSSCYRRVTKENGNSVCMSRREYIIYVKGRRDFWSEKLQSAKSSGASAFELGRIKKKLNRVLDILDSEGVN